MPHLVWFTDAVDAPPDLRQRHMPRHLAFLASNGDRIRAAGPLFEHDTPAGGLWLIEGADPHAFDALIEADPFWTTGLRDTHRILDWRQVFANGTAIPPTGK